MIEMRGEHERDEGRVRVRQDESMSGRSVCDEGRA